MIPILMYAPYFSFDRGHRVRDFLVHAGGLVAFTAAHVYLRMMLYPILDDRSLQPIPRSFALFKDATRQTLYWNLWIYASNVAFAIALYVHRRGREHAIEEARLHAKLAQAELQVLRMQLHPHFLFNTLHGISTLMGRDVPRAQTMIMRLSDLLRLALEHVSTQEVTLKRELEFLEAYLAIEKMRFQERLEVQFNIDPQTLDALVPNLILQPLAENAVRHGISRRAQGGRVQISSARDNGTLKLSIRDDGPGLPERNGTKSGVGLANTRARLQRMYGDKQHFSLHSSAGEGVLVEVEVPFNTCEAAVEPGGEDALDHGGGIAVPNGWEASDKN